MDRCEIEEVARAHKALSQQRMTGETGADAAARAARAFHALWENIQRDAEEYCAAYNEAFGASRIKVEPHPDSIIVRSQLDPQDTLVFHRTPSTDTHQGTLEIHRYHYGQPPASLPVSIQPSHAGEVTLTYDDRSITTQALIFVAVSKFAEELARAESQAPSHPSRAGN